MVLQLLGCSDSETSDKRLKLIQSILMYVGGVVFSVNIKYDRVLVLGPLASTSWLFGSGSRIKYLQIECILLLNSFNLNE